MTEKIDSTVGYFRGEGGSRFLVHPDLRQLRWSNQVFPID